MLSPIKLNKFYIPNRFSLLMVDNNRSAAVGVVAWIELSDRSGVSIEFDLAVYVLEPVRFMFRTPDGRRKSPFVKS